MRPKKALGQHFLTDESIAARIASTLDPWKGLPVMEVGPGMGVLTKYLLAEGHDVKVAEIDGESIEYLRYNYPVLVCRYRHRYFSMSWIIKSRWCAVRGCFSVRLPNVLPQLPAPSHEAY